MLTKYLNSASEIGAEAPSPITSKDSHHITPNDDIQSYHEGSKHPSNPKHAETQITQSTKSKTKTKDIKVYCNITSIPSASFPPLLSYIEASPLIEPIPARSPLEIEIEKQHEFHENRENYLAQMLDEMFEDEDNNRMHVADDDHKDKELHVSICNECERLKNNVFEWKTKYFKLNMQYIETLKENERLRNDIEMVSNKLEDTDHQWVELLSHHDDLTAEIESLMDDNFELNQRLDMTMKEIKKYQYALNTINYEIRRVDIDDKSASSTQLHKAEEEEEEDDETDVESEDTANVSVKSNSTTVINDDTLSDIVSDIFSEQSQLDEEESGCDMDQAIETEIEDDATYKFVNLCRSMYISTNELKAPLIEQLMEACTRSIVALYETKYIFDTFMHKYESILDRFNDIQTSSLDVPKSPNYCKYNAIYKLLVKNAINARFHAQSAIQMYHKSLEYAFYRSSMELTDQCDEGEQLGIHDE